MLAGGKLHLDFHFGLRRLTLELPPQLFACRLAHVAAQRSILFISG
jgi:hypothetical protein